MVIKVIGFLWCTQKLLKVKKENLVKASKQILCSQEKVLVLKWDSETFVLTDDEFSLI